VDSPFVGRWFEAEHDAWHWSIEEHLEGLGDDGVDYEEEAYAQPRLPPLVNFSLYMWQYRHVMDFFYHDIAVLKCVAAP
jgi:hypothetical protein